MEETKDKIENPNKSVENRRADGTFGPGNIANPTGRPKGKTLKEWLLVKYASGIILLKGQSILTLSLAIG